MGTTQNRPCKHGKPVMLGPKEGLITQTMHSDSLYDHSKFILDISSKILTEYFYVPLI